MLVECKTCEAVVDAQLIADYVHFNEEHVVQAKYSFLKCPKCELPFIMLQLDHCDGDGMDEPRRLYPPIDKGISVAIPLPLRMAYSEAHACFKAKAYIATAIMCRKTLEGIADENKITVRNLATALKEMKDKGIIENRLYEWADALRISGNEAAHGVNFQISHQDAKDILEFTHALLEYVFTFQEKFDQFKKRQRGLKNTN